MFLRLFFMLALTSCSLSINQVQSRGTASDLIDEVQKSEAETVPALRTF